MSDIQSVYALKSDGYNAGNLLQWIAKNGLIPLKKAHYTGDSIRYRIKMPNANKKYITKVLKNRIHLVIEI